MSFVTHDQNELVWFTAPLLDGVRHGFSTRRGGVSPAPWDTLDLRFGCGDAPENVAENYRRLLGAVGVEPEIVPIRGGTDGARLSWERDIPCPNLCTGGANFHGVHEFVPVASMEKMVQVLVELVRC